MLKLLRIDDIRWQLLVTSAVEGQFSASLFDTGRPVRIVMFCELRADRPLALLALVNKLGDVVVVEDHLVVHLYDTVPHLSGHSAGVDYTAACIYSRRISWH